MIATKIYLHEYFTLAQQRHFALAMDYMTLSLRVFLMQTELQICKILVVNSQVTEFFTIAFLFQTTILFPHCFFFFFFFFSIWVSFTNIHDSRESRGRGRVSI